MAAVAPIPMYARNRRKQRADAEVEDILKQLSALQAMRGTLDSHWQEIHDRLWPHSGDFTYRRWTEGEKRMQEVYDSTGAFGLEKFAAFMEANLTPRNQTWHHLRASNNELNRLPKVRIFFEELVRILHQEREAPKANYYSQMHEVYKSLGAYGNGCLFVDARPGGIRYKSVHIGQVYIVLDHEGRIDSVFRCYRQSAHASMRQWGERTPAKVKKVAESKDPFQKLEWLHLVRPRKGYDPERVDEDRMPFESLYISIEDKQVVDIQGYEEQAFLYSRYTVNPTETYGRGPGMLVLPHVKVANEMTKTFLRAGHRTVDPAILTYSDSVLGSGGRRFNLRPGAQNPGGLTADGKELVKAFHTGARLDMTETMLERERATIETAFFSQWGRAFLEHPNMTATQVLALVREKGENLGPVAGRQQGEILGPQIVREIGILDRLGKLDQLEIPGELIEAAGEYDIEYDSPATRYQRAAELEGLQSALEAAAFIAKSSGDPRVFKVFREDEVVRRFAEVRGGPTDLFHSGEEYAAAIQEMDQAMAAAQAIEAGQGMATMGRDMAAAQREAVEGAAVGA